MKLGVIGFSIYTEATVVLDSLVMYGIPMGFRLL